MGDACRLAGDAAPRVSSGTGVIRRVDVDRAEQPCSDVIYCNPFVVTDAALLVTYGILFEFIFKKAAPAERLTAMWFVGPWIGYTLIAVVLQLRPALRRITVTSTPIHNGYDWNIRRAGTVDEVDLRDWRARLAVALLAVVVLAPQLRLLFVSDEEQKYIGSTAALYFFMLPRVYPFFSACLVAGGDLDLNQYTESIGHFVVFVDLFLGVGLAAALSSQSTIMMDIGKYWGLMIVKVLLVIQYIR